MLKTSIPVLCVILLFLHLSQEVPLTSSPLRISHFTHEKRGTIHPRSWWTWSSQDGYKSGTGNSPSAAFASYAHAGRRPGPFDHARVAPKNDSYNGQNLTTGYIGNQPPTQSSEIQEWLHHHNRFRLQYGANPLSWDPKLVQASKNLIDTCVWRHTQNNQYGENMSAGQSTIQEVVEGWVNGPEEKDSYIGSNSAPSHFTQVVWMSTTQVGCYHSTCQEVLGANLPQSPVNFWACNYNPPGNVIGQFEENVKATAGGKPL